MLSTSILYCNKIDEQQHTSMPHRLQHPNGFGGGDVCESGSSAVIDANDDDDDDEEEEGEERKQAKNLANNRPVLMSQNHSYPSFTPLQPCRVQYLKSSLLPPLSSSSSLILNGSAISSSAKSILTKRTVHNDGNSRFRVQYIGCNTCDYRQHKPENGIGIYQKPMLDLYSTVLKRSVVLRSLLAVNQVADLSLHGIFIAEKDRFQQQQSTGRSTATRPSSSASSTSKQQQQQQQPSPQSLTSDTVVTKVITPLSNILLWAAVRLQHRTQMKKLKNSAIKKRHVGVAFVPLSCSEAVLDKNAFVTLNAKQRFLLGINHPPLFVCVLQKVNSAQRLECHMFVCGNGDDAIRMCNRMDDLRQQSNTIGHLHLPPPGCMGKYFYQNHHHTSPSLLSTTRSSSLMSTSMLTPRSCSPSQRTMSEQSTMMTSSRPRFSDIEEEDIIDGDDVETMNTTANIKKNGQRRTVVKKLIDNYQSNADANVGHNIPTTMNNLKGIKMINNNNNNNINHHNHHRLHGGGHQMMMAMMMINNNHNNSKLKCDARLFDRTRRVITKVAGSNNYHNNNNHPHLMNGNGDGNCPSELSSIISSKVSISSSNNLERKKFEQQREREPQSSMLQQQVAAPSLMAQRDYRFEAYKANVCNNHPDDDDDGGGGGNKNTNTPNSSIKLIKSSSNQHHNHHHQTTDIINNGGGGSQPPPQFQQQRINHDRSINNTIDNGNNKADNNDDENDVNDDADDDELHKNRLFAKAAAKAGSNLNSNLGLGSVVPSAEQESNQQDQNDRITNRNNNKKKTYLFGDSLRSRQRRKHLSTNLDLLHQSLVANTNKDDAGMVANGPTNLNHHSIISSSIFLDNESDERSTSKESSVNSQQKVRTKHSNGPKGQETETVRLPPATRNNRNGANSSSEKEMDKPLKLYLPPSANGGNNLGVKGFSKSSRVEQWSTMVADPTTNNGRTMNNSCDLCQMELNCDECCQFCQAIEQYKQKYCQKCQADEYRTPVVLNNDDFVLDETILKHFNMNHRESGSVRPLHSQRPETMYYHVPRTRSFSNTTGVSGADPTFFNRIRRFSWQSLFGSRKKFQGSRLWNRFRSGSQRLRGSRRFFQNKSRIFLPNNSNSYVACPAQSCQSGAKGPEESSRKKMVGYSYDEHYLKPPARQQRLLEPVFSSRKSSPSQKNCSPFSIDDHQHDDDYGKQFYGFTTIHSVQEKAKKKFDTRTNEKIIETNNQDKFLLPNAANGDVKKNTTTMAMTKNGEAIKKADMNNHKHDANTRPTAINESVHGKSSLADIEDDDEDDAVENKIKPFFISHPGKTSNAAVESSGQQPPQNGISISSDSGMEEYECHSSAEHSPSGFHNGQPSLHQQQQHQKQRRTMANNNYSTNHKYNLQQQQLKLGVEKSTNQNGSTTTAASKILSSPVKFPKDIRRQAGHWSNTNLENQLGYMP